MAKWKHALIWVAVGLLSILIYKKVAGVQSAVNKIPGFA